MNRKGNPLSNLQRIFLRTFSLICEQVNLRTGQSMCEDRIGAVMQNCPFSSELTYDLKGKEPGEKAGI